MKEITLRADISHDLCWEIDIPSEEQIIWHLDFGWNETPLDFTNSTHFNSCLLAMEEFVKQIWEKYSEQTLGVVLAYFQEGLIKNIEHANFLSDYLHRLASFLPDECPPIIKVEIGVENRAELVQIFCLRRFEYFKLEFIGKTLPIRGNDATTGVIIPSDEKMNLGALENMLSSLDQKNQSYQCIPEELLNEYWGGLETLIFKKEMLSDTGMRMLLGFEAAGGNIQAYI